MHLMEPRTKSDRGGWLMMPVCEHVPHPTDPGWKLTHCPECGRECWDRPLAAGFTEDMFAGKVCTICALKKWNRQQEEGGEENGKAGKPGEGT